MYICTYVCIASFPGLPRFFCSSVSVIRVLLSTETEEQKKRGRPGNEAMYACVSLA